MKYLTYIFCILAIMLTINVSRIASSDLDFHTDIINGMHSHAEINHAYSLQDIVSDVSLLTPDTMKSESIQTYFVYLYTSSVLTQVWQPPQSI